MEGIPMIDNDPIRVFISSKQKEFETERRVMKDIVQSSPLMAPVLAEDFAPQRDDVRSRFLGDVGRCPIYVGLFGCVYSAPTEDEYRHALLNSAREILIYDRPCPDGRDEKLSALITDIQANHVPAKLGSVAKLRKQFAEHLHLAVARMVRLLLDQAAPPPRAQGDEDSVIAAAWTERRLQLMAMGFPVNDVDQLAAMTSKYRSAANHLGHFRP
jgi:hypothetical protein